MRSMVGGGRWRGSWGVVSALVRLSLRRGAGESGESGGQGGFGAFDYGAGQDGGDGEGVDRRHGGVDFTEPLRELRRGARIDDAAEADPAMGGGAHGAVFARGVDGGACAFGGRHVPGGPAGHLSLGWRVSSPPAVWLWSSKSTTPSAPTRTEPKGSLSVASAASAGLDGADQVLEIGLVHGIPLCWWFEIARDGGEVQWPITMPRRRLPGARHLKIVDTHRPVGGSSDHGRELGAPVPRRSARALRDGGEPGAALPALAAVTSDTVYRSYLVGGTTERAIVRYMRQHPYRSNSGHALCEYPAQLQSQGRDARGRRHVPGRRHRSHHRLHDHAAEIVEPRRADGERQTLIRRLCRFHTAARGASSRELRAGAAAAISRPRRDG